MRLHGSKQILYGGFILVKDSQIKITDTVVMGDVNQTISGNECPGCFAANVRVMMCQISDCETKFCELCHAKSRFSEGHFERFDSGHGSGPFCAKCLISTKNQYEEKKKLERERVKAESAKRERKDREREERAKIEQQERMERINAESKIKRLAKELRWDELEKKVISNLRFMAISILAFFTFLVLQIIQLEEDIWVGGNVLVFVILVFIIWLLRIGIVRAENWVSTEDRYRILKYSKKAALAHKRLVQIFVFTICVIFGVAISVENIFSNLQRIIFVSGLLSLIIRWMLPRKWY
jgi:hypothetical protein